MFSTVCGHDDYAVVASVPGTGYRLTGLKKGTMHKAFVRAYRTVNGEKTYIGQSSPTVHAIVGGYNRTRADARRVTVKRSKVKLAVGKLSTIKASVRPVRNGRRVLAHVNNLRYYSSNNAVASVSAAGRITAVGEGACTIYVIANNGVRAAVKVTVK